jgi:two-component system response regulator EvgA
VIRLLIADDDPLVRTGLRMLLKREEVEIVGETGDGAGVLRLLENVPADVVLMDVQMPRVNGIAAIPPIRARFPDLRIVLMTTFQADRFVEHARTAGADALIRKSVSVPELVHALRGEKSPAPRAPRTLPAMSPRERDVGMRIARGNSNDQIANDLGVSVNTVKTYVSRLFGKFGVANRVQLANTLNGVRLERSTLREPGDD